jgi:HAD superfamily hydrolase (TIGR01549 family)
MEKLPRVELAGRLIPSSAGKLHETLPAAAEVEFEQFVEVLLQVDREYRKSRYAKHLELPTVERFTTVCDRLRLSERLGSEADQLPEALAQAHMGMLRDFAATPEHHASVLATLGESLRIGLCSNFSHTPTAHALLEQYGLKQYFDSLVVSEDRGIRKPRPEIFESVLQELGVDAQHTLHVGDNLQADVAGATAVGMRTAWITRRVRDPEAKLRDYDGPAPSWQISDLRELPALIEAAKSAE